MSRLLGIISLLLTYSVVFAEEDYLSKIYRPLAGSNLSECQQALSKRSGGWCEIRHSKDHPSISSVWPTDLDQKTRMVTGPSSILHAWNSAAFDSASYRLYFMSGGHADYGGNEVYRFDLKEGSWSRITDPSPLNYLFIQRDYDKNAKKKWRRLCWIPDVRNIPASTHTYDGLIFSNKTKTVFLYVMGAANGSCIEDMDNSYKNSPLVLGGNSATIGWYEFNPDETESRNGIQPLKWRKVFDYDFFKNNSITQGYPVSAQDIAGRIIFGSRFKTIIYDPEKPDSRYIQSFTSQADWGDGTKFYDASRNVIWSLHRKQILAFDGDSGKQINRWPVVSGHGKSLAVGKDGRIYSWSGKSNIAVFDPDSKSGWKIMEWGRNGPTTGDARVYGKWIYLDKEDLFVGLSTHRTGVWVYKHPENASYTPYSNINAQKLIDQAKPGDVVSIPEGIYQQGLFVNKSLTLKLKDAELRGTVNQKGIINISCNGCDVTIEDYRADGIRANCLWGNCAAIKVEGRNFKLTLRRVFINNTVIGLLSDNRGGEIVVEDSVIQNTGLNDTSTTLGHGFYAGDIDRVVMKNSIIRRSFSKGHLFKSRAAETEIIHSVIAGLDGRPSRVIDFPCGGKLTVTNSVLQQGKWTDNIDLISVGTEPQNCGGSVPPSDVTVKDNWIIFEREETPDEPAANHGFTRMFTWRAPVGSIKVTGNRIVDRTGRFQYDGEGKLPATFDGNYFYNTRQESGFKVDQLEDLSN